MKKALRLFRDLRVADTQGEVYALVELGELARLSKDHPEAQKRLNCALKVAQREGDHLGYANACLVLGDLKRDQGNWKSCRAFLQKALERFEELEMPLGLGNVEAALGELEIAHGNVAASKYHYTRAL